MTGGDASGIPPTRSAHRVGLVADDFTGAADAAVQFAEAGWLAELVGPGGRPHRSGNRERPEVLAIATSVRAASHEEAAAATAAAVHGLRGSVDRLFVKIDSTIRGSVAGQVEGALAAWATDHLDAVAVICPAFPGQGRVVVQGRVLVNGRPAHETAAADDPVTPLRESRLDRVFEGAVSVPSADLGVAHQARMLLCDAETDAHLDRLAAALLRLGSGAVAVGSAGLAAAMARCWSSAQGRQAACAPPLPVTAAAHRRVLVAVSSLHPLALAQVRELASWDRQSSVELLLTPSERTPDASPPQVAAAFAERVAQRLARGDCDGLVLVGGDGAGAVLQRLRADRFLISSAIVPGAAQGIIVGGAADGLRLVTKSGGFGTCDTLVTIVRKLLSASSPEVGDAATPGDPQRKEPR